MRAEIALKWGRLRLQTLSLQLPPEVSGQNVRATLNGQAVPVTARMEGQRLTLTLPSDTVIQAGETLQVRVG